MKDKGLISSTKDGHSRRVYYKLTSKGVEVIEKLPDELMGLKDYLDGKLLGILSLYDELFGREALDLLLGNYR
jgi:DNA-binding PadR family transcriptional regulator